MKFVKILLWCSFIVFGASTVIASQSSIITANSLNDVQKYLNKAESEKSWILFDLHYVIFMQNSQLLRPCGQIMLNRFFAQYKNNPNKLWEMEKAILQQRQEIALTTDTIDIINKLSKYFNYFLFLTSYPTQKQYNDLSMEQFRLEQLQNIGIKLSQLQFNKLHSLSNIKSEDLNFYNNIVFCKNDAKGISLKKLLEITKKPKHIYFIDDRLKNIQDVSEVCQQLNIDFTGFYYVLAYQQHCKLDIAVAKKQLQILASSNQWIEDYAIKYQ